MEVLSAGIQRLKGIKERLQPQYKMVGVRDILDETHENLWWRDPDVLPHPHLLYHLAWSVLTFADQYYGGQVKPRGSLTRHAAAFATQKIGPEDFFHSRRYNVDRRMRFNVLPQMYEELENLPDEISSAYYELLPGPDLDFKLPPYKKGENAAEANKAFFDGIVNNLLPYISNELASSDFYNFRKNAGKVTQDIKRLAQAAKENKTLTIEGNEDIGHRIEQLEVSGNDFAYAVRLPLSVNVAPVKEKQWRNKYPPDLVLYARRVVARGKIPLMEISFCADIGGNRSKTLKLDELHKILTLEFISSLPPAEAALADARTGPAVTTYDNASSKVQIKPYHYKDSNWVANIPTDEEYLPNTPSVVIKVPKETLETLSQPVDLGPAWEQRTPADAIDIAGRVIWQAIDAEINGMSSTPFVGEETLERIARHLGQQDPKEWDSIPQFQKWSLRKTLLVSMVASPHRFLEYTGKTGILSILLRHKKGTPNFGEALDEIRNKDLISQQEYLEAMIGDPRKGFMPNNLREKFINGWDLVDHALRLKDLYPEKTVLERLYRLATL